MKLITLHCVYYSCTHLFNPLMTTGSPPTTLNGVWKEEREVEIRNKLSINGLITVHHV